GYNLFCHFDGTIIPPPKFAIVDKEGGTFEITAAYKNWIHTCLNNTNKDFLNLMIATLSNEVLEYVIGGKTAREAWLHLFDCYVSVSRARINHLKIELQTTQKGVDTIERYLLILKHIRDQLAYVAIKISDDDFMIAALNGLPSEYDMIKTILIAHDSSISLKDFRAQLLVAEQTAES
ncbi:unnamed protein product, partial [Prunus brigantina]